jgi:squalene synthase HpnC
MNAAFAVELERLGPGRPHAPFDLPRARAYCRRLALGHYENFTVASLLLPRRLLRHFHAVYAYCRWADDLADEAGGGDRALDLLAWWRDQLLACYGGRPTHPVFIALQPTIERFRIPPQPFLDLLSAFEQDQRVKRYETYEELLEYCRRSANPVGRLVLYLGETFDETRAALSDHICTGLQLANFWQDVRRDFDVGRVYLPAEDRRRFGYGDDDLEARRFTPAFAELMRFEVDRTRGLFEHGRPLVEMMPADLRIDVELFLRGGLAVLDKIEQCGHDVWSRRPVVSKWDKTSLLAGALLGRHGRPLAPRAAGDSQSESPTIPGQRIWFRLTFQAGRDLLHEKGGFNVMLYALDEKARVWLNGVELQPEQRAKKNTERSFPIAEGAGLLRPGRNVVAASAEALPPTDKVRDFFDLRIDVVRKPHVPEALAPQYSEKDVTLRAVVCDLCSDQPGQVPACVNACPHDAAMRVNARTEFPE